MSNSLNLKKQSVVVKMCISAVLAAICFVLDFYASEISKMLFGNALKISFSGLPIILAAIICGPLYGAATGLIGALINQLILYGFTATTVLWVLPNASRGLVVGLLFVLFGKNMNAILIIFETVVGALVTTAFNTLALYVDSRMNGYYSYAFIVGGLLPRILTGVATAVILAIIILPIVKIVKKNIPSLL